MTSYIRMSERGRETSQTYHLRAAVEVVPVEPYETRNPWTGVIEMVNPNTYRVMGECGHQLDLVRAGHHTYWERAIADQKRHRKRCRYCPKHTD